MKTARENVNLVTMAKTGELCPSSQQKLQNLGKPRVTIQAMSK
jgi:hypothetical protein